MITALLACSLPHPAEIAPAVPSRAAAGWETLAEPGPLTIETVVSARWEVPLHGLLDLEAAAAIDPSVVDRPTPIVLPVTVLRHPERGQFVVDTGIDRDCAAGGPGPARGLVRGFLGKLEPVEPLAAIVARNEAPVAAVLLTHGHLDHVLGLRDLPGVPVIAGPGELEGRSMLNLVIRRTYVAAFEEARFQALDPATAVRRAPFDAAWDLVGDGSLWALWVPGHTAGSLAFLARTVDGPVLLVGDTSHTRWGWDHGVPPGTYSEDPEGNRESLDRLRAFVAEHPEIRVLVGHEL